MILFSKILNLWPKLNLLICILSNVYTDSSILFWNCLVQSTRILQLLLRNIAKPAASQDLELLRPPYKTRLRAGVSQKSFRTGLSVGACRAIAVELIEGLYDKCLPFHVTNFYA